MCISFSRFLVWASEIQLFQCSLKFRPFTYMFGYHSTLIKHTELIVKKGKVGQVKKISQSAGFEPARAEPN